MNTKAWAAASLSAWFRTSAAGLAAAAGLLGVGCASKPETAPQSANQTPAPVNAQADAQPGTQPTVQANAPAAGQAGVAGAAQAGNVQAGAQRPGRPTTDESESAPASKRNILETFAELDLPPANSTRTARGLPGPDYWQQEVDYVIDVALDEQTKAVTGKARITYTNNSPDDLDVIWMGMEQNLFDPSSKGARLSTRGGRFGNRQGFDGGFEIASLTTAGQGQGQALAYEVYDTVARVDLPAPIQAKGGKFSFEIAWSFTIPPYGSDRLGMDDVEQGTIYQLAQWFPNVCVYDDTHGWNTLPYLGQGEFYTNFGTYEVNITVPRSHIVAATGVLQNPQDVLTSTQIERLEAAKRSKETVMIRSAEEVADPASRPTGEGPLTWRFRAEQVRTVAWASSASFIWDAAAVDGDATGPGGTLAQSVYPKEAAETWDASTDMLRFSIEHYNQMWFRYPYPVAINVNGRVGGMEYPMIIFCRARGDERGLWGVTTHEIGHNWFPMVVNTDERRHSWMDEGFNTFINYYAGKARYPESSGGRGSPKSFANSMRNPPLVVMDTPADRLGGSHGMMSYSKPAVMLVLLRESILGPERFDRAFREYIRRWAFKSPRPEDFFRTMQDVSGEHLDWFWRTWVYQNAKLDQGVRSVDVREDGRVTVTFENLGDMVMPVRWAADFEDGSTVTNTLPVEAWHLSDRASFTWNPGKKVVGIRIDPDGEFPDLDTRNNTWKAEAGEPAPSTQSSGS